MWFIITLNPVQFTNAIAGSSSGPFVGVIIMATAGPVLAVFCDYLYSLSKALCSPAPPIAAKSNGNALRAWVYGAVSKILSLLEWPKQSSCSCCPRVSPRVSPRSCICSHSQSSVQKSHPPPTSPPLPERLVCYRPSLLASRTLLVAALYRSGQQSSWHLQVFPARKLQLASCVGCSSKGVKKMQTSCARKKTI